MREAGKWRQFFDSEAGRYDENPHTQHTVAEVDFLLALNPLPRGASLLDLGCGTGRHAVEFATRGYAVTGVDYSEAMLEVAARKAAARGVDVKFIHCDIRELDLSQQFDSAICICEGGPGLIERGEDPKAHDRAIFRKAAEHLKLSAPFVVTALNGYSVIRQMKDEFVGDGRFNPATMVSQYTDEWQLSTGVERVNVYERLFIAPEMVELLTSSGFLVDAVYGGTAGYWARRPLSLDEVEAMYVCRKRG